MKDFNELFFEIRLGSDAVLRKTNSGKSVLNFGGANHATSDKDREPLWIAFRAWEKLAETIAEQMTKGRKIMIKGHIPVLPAPQSKNGKVVRNGAECYLSGDSKAVVRQILELVKAGDERVSDLDKVITAITNQHSTQVVVDVDKLRYMDERGLERDAAPAEDLELDTTPDDDIPF